MKFGVENPDGTKSIDRKVKKLLDYINKNLNNQVAVSAGRWTETQAAQWAKDTIEQGVKNIASSVFAVRLD